MLLQLEFMCGMVIWNTLLMSYQILLNLILKISGIKLVTSKMPWLLKYLILPCARVVVTGVLTEICKLV